MICPDLRADLQALYEHCRRALKAKVASFCPEWDKIQFPFAQLLAKHGFFSGQKTADMKFVKKNDMTGFSGQKFYTLKTC